VLRTPKNEYSFAISKVEIVNAGAPIFKVTCSNVRVTQEEMRELRGFAKWQIDGAGNQFKPRIPPVIHVNTHTPPNGIGVSTFTADLVLEFFPPLGSTEIHFGPPPPPPPPPKYLPLVDTNTPPPVVLPDLPVETYERSFENLEIDTEESE
jgi:hypothetical protein